ncbi:hypothetical protein U1Q18_008068 [Sarracenia purpurea var. burkii]
MYPSEGIFFCCCHVGLSWVFNYFGHGISSADVRGALLLLYCGLVMGVYYCCHEGLVLLSWALAPYAAVMGGLLLGAASFAFVLLCIVLVAAAQQLN